MTQPEQEAREMLAACPNPECQSSKIDIKAEPRLDGGMQGISECWDCGVRGPSTPHYIGSSRAKNTAAAKLVAAEMWNAFAARPTAGIDREVVRKLLDNLRYKLGHVQIARQNGDNLAVALCSHFEDDSYDCEEEEDENGWTPSASAGCDEMLAAIHALYADAILALLPTPAKTGERDAVIEECARVADDHLTAQFGKALCNMGSDQILHDTAMEAGAAKNIAAAIRALSQPLPDAPIVGKES